jgi:hypothetical protein
LMFQRGARPHRGRPGMQAIGHRTSVESRATREARRKWTSAGVARSQVESEGGGGKGEGIVRFGEVGTRRGMVVDVEAGST